MLSGKLIHLIETHETEITASIIRSIRQHEDLAHLGQRPDADLRERGQKILKNLGHWLAHGNEETLAQEYELIGKERYEESIPLHESIRGLCVIKDKMIDFIGEQGFEKDYLEIYAEEELNRRVGRFFDLLLIHLVRGYEAARHHAMHAHA